VGRMPVRSSKSTIPKLYTSPFSVTFPVSMYSGHTNEGENLIQLQIFGSEEQGKNKKDRGEGSPLV
jgi:hypothetical protein